MATKKATKPGTRKPKTPELPIPPFEDLDTTALNAIAKQLAALDFEGTNAAAASLFGLLLAVAPLLKDDPNRSLAAPEVGDHVDQILTMDMLKRELKKPDLEAVRAASPKPGGTRRAVRGTRRAACGNR